MRDHEARTSEITEVDPLDDDTLTRARLTVCAHSATAAEARDLFLMLGLDPSQQDDPSYGTSPSHLATGGHGLSHSLGNFDSPHTTRRPHALRSVADPKGN